MSGRSSGAVITRYAGLQVQTSALGLNIPVGWGTFRCKCNLVWYNNFKSTANKASSGKGGGSVTTGYSYSADLIVAICEGPIDSVTQVYVNSNKYSTAAQAGLSIATGATGQAVWSHLTAAYPTQAIGYSGLAIAYAAHYPLGSSASPPNHSFEVKRTASFGVAGTEDADPSLVVTDFFTNTRTGVPSWGSGLLGDLTQYQDYCLAAGLLVSPVIDQQRSASDFLTELLRATNSTCVWSEGVLKFIPYGDTPLTGNGKTFTPNVTPIYSLDDDDFVVDKGSAPLLVDIMDQSDAYNVVQLEYLDRTNQYNMAIALSSDAANVAQYGMRRKDPDTVHCICTPTVAALSSQLFLQRTLYTRGQYKFKLGWMFAILEPGDIVEVTDAGLGLSAYPVRIIQIDEDEKYGLSITAEDAQIGIAHTPLYDMQNSAGYVVDRSLDPGSVEANLLLWTEDLTNAAWTLGAATVTANATTDPLFGTTTADKLIPTAVSALHYCEQLTTSVFPQIPYTSAVYIKPAGRKICRLHMGDGAGNNGEITVDTSSGLVTVAATNNGTNTGTTATVSSVGSGWYRLSLTTVFATVATMNVVAYVLDDLGNPTWTGDGVNGLYVWGAQLKQGVDTPAYAATYSTIAGPYLFNPPAVLANGQMGEVWAAVSGGAYWGGANVWTSIDGTNYEQIGVITAAARYGTATAAFAAGSDPDTTHTLSVDVGPSEGLLTGASSAAADSDATLCLIDNELIAYETATLTGPHRYNLTTYIRRGVLGTAIASHTAGAPFVRLDEAIFDFPYSANQAGKATYVKFQSFNLWGAAVQSLADCNAYSITPSAQGPTAPGAGSWAAVGGTISIGGAVVPAIQVNGASDNPSAAAIVFLYRVHGSTPWIDAGMAPNTTTQTDITSVIASTSYDVGVAYIVNDVLGAVFVAGTVTTGTSGLGALATLGSVDMSTSQVINKTASNITYTAGGTVDSLKPAQAGATKNVVTYANTAPSSPTDGDIWVNTTAMPYVANMRVGGAWQPAAAYVTDTGQVTDGAGLGNRAIWTGVTGTGKPADNATKNVTTYSSTAPGGPTNGDIWVDTSPTPPVVYLRDSGSWQLAANLVTDTNDITDGRGLGNTALWTGVSGVAKPADYATKNVTTYSATAPSSPTDGDIWVDTVTSPTVTYLRTGGAWQAAANHVTDTGQISDGAGLGTKATWGSTISGTPGNLSALSGSEDIQNTILHSAITAGSVPVPLAAVSGAGALAAKNTVGASDIAAGAVQSPAVHVGLMISAAASNGGTISISGDQFILTDSSLGALATGAVSISATLSSTGPTLGGLDTGTRSSDTFYYVYLTSNGTLVKPLFSLSATSPTLPSGYTYFARIGWVFFTLSDIRPFTQHGHNGQYTVLGGWSLPLMASGAASLWTAVDMSSFLPSCVSQVEIVIQGLGINCTMAAPNSNYGAINSSSPPPLVAGWAAGSTQEWGVMAGVFTIDVYPYIYYFGASSNSHVYCLGWTDTF
jgi:hypothetical protein